ncbi:hypothetical protein Tco_0985953 [Tanacetum coccineum]
MGLLDFIKTADPRKVQPVEVQKKDDHVKLLESTSHCFMSLVTPAAGDSRSAAAPEVYAPEVSAPAEVDPENVSDTLPAKQLRKDHPSLATSTGGKTLARLRQLMPTSPLVLRASFQAEIQAHVVVQSTRFTDVLVYTAAAAVTSARENMGVTPMSDVAGSSQLDTSEGSDDFFYELPALNSAEAKHCMDYEQLYTEFNVGAARQICLESEVRSRAEHELELKEKLKGKYDAHGRLLEEKDLEILRLKSLLAEEAERAEKAETAEVVRLRGQVSALTGEVSVLKSTIAQKDTDISLLDSRATYLKSALDDSKAACAEAGSLITSLTSERDRLTSEVSTLHTAFQDFKEKAEAQQEEQAQVLYNRVAKLEAHVMDVYGCLEGEFYPAYLTILAGRIWFLTHGIQLAVLKCLKSPEYQGILGHALGRAVDFGMQEGLEAGALEDVDFPLVNLLKSKKDAGMDEVLDWFILDGPLADLPEAAHLQPCLEQLSVPIHHSDDKAIVGDTSLLFALLNVHSRAECNKASSVTPSDIQTFRCVLRFEGVTDWYQSQGYREPVIMSSATSAVTYTSVYTDSEPGRAFWGADDEEVSEGGIPRVIVLGYDGLPIQPVAPPSPDYIPGPEDPQTPPVPQDEDEHEFPAEEQPLPPVDSPTAESPEHVTESDPEEDPEEYEDDETEDGPVDYPMDGGDDGDDDDGDSSRDDANDEDEDDDDEEEEEHIALADSTIVAPVDEPVFPPEGIEPVIPPPSTDITIGARITVRPQTSISLPPEAEVERLLTMTTPSPSPPISLSPPSAGERLARCMAPPAHSSPLLPSSGCPTQIQTLRIASTQALIDAVTATLPSPPLPSLPPSLYIPPPVDRRDDIPESEQPPCKRLYLSTLGSRYEVGESSTARPTRGQGIDYRFM